MLSRIVIVLGVVGIAGCWEEEPPIVDCLCTEHYAPVCGVDGVTYGNACEAGCAGVEIAHEGECGLTTCTGDDQCGMGQFCSFEECYAYAEVRAPTADGGMPYPCEGICRDLPPPPTECYANEDCPSGEQCVFNNPCLDDPHRGGEDHFIACPGQCEPIPPPPPQCNSDYECGPGFICQFDPTTPCYFEADRNAGEPGAAPPSDIAYPYCGICVPAPTPICYSDADCAPQDYCDFSCDGGDQKPLPAGADAGFARPYPVDHGVCRPRPYTGCEVALCGPGTHCEEICQEEFCGTDARCPVTCHIECVPDAPLYCSSDIECLPGQVCAFNCPRCLPGEMCPAIACFGECVYEAIPFAGQE